MTGTVFDNSMNWENVASVAFTTSESVAESARGAPSGAVEDTVTGVEGGGMESSREVIP
jgi:hypothetical protein